MLIKISVKKGGLDNTTLKMLSNIKAGTYHTILAKKIVKNELKGSTDIIEKISEYHCRWKCKWSNTIYAKNSNSNGTATSNYTPIIDNLIYYNSNTQRYYLRMIGTNNSYLKTKSKYKLNGKETAKQDLINKGYIKDKTFTDNGILMIGLEQVIEIR